VSSAATPSPEEAQRNVETQRTLGLFESTGIGVGAIVGGGILVLAGVAFQNAGPSAVLAFTVNGLIAVMTAMSFAEMSSAFPESGGAYTFAKKVLSARLAFAVGWLLWFAYIVAGVLYALGFAEYAALVLRIGWEALFDEAPAWLGKRASLAALALLATGIYTVSLIRSTGGGGEWATWGKVVLFAVLIAGGVWGLATGTGSSLSQGMTPFFAGGTTGLLSAMGFSFIALQGFDLVAAVAGEVRNPRRVILRAMLYSLGIALVVYIPLLVVVSTAGVPAGQSIAAISKKSPSTIIADAVRNYMGVAGYWLVIVAAVLATLSALRANLLAASRVAFTMARDRNLPPVLETLHAERRTPLMAVYASALALAAILLMLPDLASAGAAASLIFLLVFALAHWTAYLARRRSAPRSERADAPPDLYRTPWFPLLPVTGGVACVAMGVFQAVVVPAAGGIMVVWLGLGVLLYFSLFAARSQAVDAFSEGVDPEMMRLRGHSPFVLVPVANPEQAPGLVGIASALAPHRIGRVLLLSVIARQEERGDRAPVSFISSNEALAERARERVQRVQEVQRQALLASMSLGHEPECLITLGKTPWSEILRVAKRTHCTGLVMGLGDAPEGIPHENLEGLLNTVGCDVIFVKAPRDFRLRNAKRILVPVGGRGTQHELRARVLGSLGRSMTSQQMTLLTVIPTSATEERERAAQRILERSAADKTRGLAVTTLVRSDDSVEAIVDQAAEHDVVIVGLDRVRGRRVFGDFALAVAHRAQCAVVMLSQG
jgi:amino acid transporter/nucleotide-binding universal stress UspA family protein